VSTINFDSTIIVTDSGLIDPTEKPPVDDRIDQVLISEQYIHERVRGLANQIARDYKGVTKLHIIALLDGAYMIAADLGREIYKAGGPEVDQTFRTGHTYGDEIKTTGEFARKATLSFEPGLATGKDVLLLDDIVDQGITLPEAYQKLLTDTPRSLKTCILLKKRLSKQTLQSVRIDYLGFEIPDKWVAGYGLDAAHDFRNLPCIVTVNRELYRS